MKDLPRMNPLVTPVVNLNGDSRENLVNYRLNVMTALDNVIEELFKGMPHGRDYQTTGGYAIVNGDIKPKNVAARMAWEERITLLRELRSEFVADAIAIKEQGK